jgi:cytoskeletal protein RodZ
VPAFGDKFRKAREAKKLSLDDVSRVTKIGARMLQAIEEEHFDQLPGGVFNRGFIRAYAKHLGLNDEEAVTDYLACLRQAQIEANQFREPAPPPVRTPAPAKAAPPVKPTPPQPAPKSRAAVDEVELPELQLPRAEDVRSPARSYPGRRESSFSSMTIPLAIIVILAVVLLWMRHSRSSHPQVNAALATKPIMQSTPISQPVPSQGAPPTNIPSSTRATANNSPAPSATKPITPSSPAENSSADKKSQAANTEVIKSNATSVPAHNASVSAQPDPKPAGTTDSEADDVTVRSPAKAAPAPKAAGSMTLVIRARENTWISVLADGQLVSQETLIAPANTTIHATREISVKVGNAAGVSFLWNNQDVPAQGGESEVKTLVFDAQGMRVSSQPTPQN